MPTLSRMPEAPARPAFSKRTDNAVERILTSFDTNYVWHYGQVKEGLLDLYEKAKVEQWNGSTALDWTTEVDPEEPILPPELLPVADWAPFRKLAAKEQAKFGHAVISWQLSQFMHGEQGALIAASQLVGAAPWIDAKYYAASQTMDEARHVEVFSRYLSTKLEWEWPVNTDLKSLLDLILVDSRWDLKYLGMQVLIEGLAMAAFANLFLVAREPLLKELIHNVMRDEARHVAFGVLSLRGVYDEMDARERREREQFVVEACALMRDRLVGIEVGDWFGFDRVEFRQQILESVFFQTFRLQLFSRVVPNLKRLGLLTPFVRDEFEKLGILHFESQDPDAQDALLGLG